jgi:hypothetical protein
MIVSPSKKFIFVQVPRTGGTSMQKFLHERIPRLIDTTPPSNMPISRIKEVYNKPINNFFKFAFVRNPWDWVVSLYMFHKYIIGKNWAKKYAKSDIIEFNNFVTYLHNRKEKHAAPLSRMDLSIYYCINGKSAMDFVGRFENLHKDFSYICKRLGIVYAAKMFPDTNKVTRSHYSTYYNDRSKQLVEKYFKHTINTYGYKFLKKDEVIDAPRAVQPYYKVRIPNIKKRN